MGDKVRMRDYKIEIWRYGTVTRTEPTAELRGKATPITDDSGMRYEVSKWRFVEKVEVWFCLLFTRTAYSL